MECKIAIHEQPKIQSDRYRFLLAELYINTLTSLPTKGHVKIALQKLRKGAV